MQNNRNIILAINPGTRYIGIAVLEGTDLLDWSVKVISGEISRVKLQRMMNLINELISFYEPETIVLKRLHQSRSSKALKQFCSQVERLADSGGIKLSRYSIDEIKAFFAPGEKINKLRLAELICKKHPVLRRELEKEQDNLNPYHIRMFEAVALATMEESLMHCPSEDTTDMNCCRDVFTQSPCITHHAGV
jgi:RNase H-fold protein (predicted Holliday junction resolvase)